MDFDDALFYILYKLVLRNRGARIHPPCPLRVVRGRKTAKSAGCPKKVYSLFDRPLTMYIFYISDFICNLKNENRIQCLAIPNEVFSNVAESIVGRCQLCWENEGR